jgi:hypothetical protein
MTPCSLVIPSPSLRYGVTPTTSRCSGREGRGACRVGYEHGHLAIDRAEVGPITIRVTHGYQRSNGLWLSLTSTATTRPSIRALTDASTVIWSRLDDNVVSQVRTARSRQAVSIDLRGHGDSDDGRAPYDSASWELGRPRER